MFRSFLSISIVQIKSSLVSPSILIFLIFSPNKVEYSYSCNLCKNYFHFVVQKNSSYHATLKTNGRSHRKSCSCVETSQRFSLFVQKRLYSNGILSIDLTLWLQIHSLYTSLIYHFALCKCCIGTFHS